MLTGIVRQRAQSKIGDTGAISPLCACQVLAKPLYPLDGIIEAELQFTTPAKEVKNRQQSAEVKRKKPVISATPKKEWRI